LPVSTQGNLSVATTRLLKVILPGTCLWTSLRDVEGFGYDETLSELKTLYAANGQDTTDDDDYNGLPTAIRDMIESKNVIEALGSMMWCAVIIFWSKCNWTK
jgi:DNA mismatch repair protein MSH6